MEGTTLTNPNKPSKSVRMLSAELQVVLDQDIRKLKAVCVSICSALFKSGNISLSYKYPTSWFLPVRSLIADFKVIDPLALSHAFQATPPEFFAHLTYDSWCREVQSYREWTYGTP